jgi:lysophospholipase L1-like esterase
MKAFFQNIILSLITLIILLLVCEGIFRIYYYSKGVQTVQIEDTLGWDVVHNLQKTDQRIDFKANPYRCTYTIDKNGFRKFGNPRSNKPKIFFVGDSFTQAEDSSDDSTYFSIVAQRANIEVFAYGVGGFGSVQEMMILQKYILQIQPDLVVMQFTSNDFINNCYDLEFRSIQNNNLTRPYLNINNKIEYRFAKNYPNLRNFANRYSRFLYFIFTRLDKAFRKTDSFKIEDYQESFELSKIAYENIKKICKSKNIPLTSFMVDGVNNVESNLYHELMKQAGIEILAEVPNAIEQAEKVGKCCKAEDGGHWNHTGHKICGIVLADSILKKKSILIHSK